MNIEVTDTCTLNCSSCSRPRTGHSFMPMRRFKTIVDKLPVHSGQLFLFWRGESTLHSELPEMAEYAKTSGYSTYLSTNGCTRFLSCKPYVSKLLNNLDTFTFCMDGYNQETVEAYRRRAQFKQILRNLDTLAKTESLGNRHMRVLMFRHNDGYESFYRTLAESARFTHISYSSPIILGNRVISKTQARRWLSKQLKYQRYYRDGRVWRHHDRVSCVPHHCISVDGAVAPCGNDWNLEYPLGNMLTDSWSEIQRKTAILSPKIMNMQLPICHSCCCGSSVQINYTEKLT
jgi:MoaA/NifB/PqqE/SkfB family radical SAM enzyme